MNYIRLENLYTMKNIFTYFLFSCFFLFAKNTFSQCSVNIIGTQTVCVGAQPTFTASLIGPVNSLMASNTAGNNHRGNMFDIVATNAITITSFDVSPMGNTTIEVYYKTGTWNGFANTPSAWTLVASFPVIYTGGFVNVPLSTLVTIPAGATYSFYVTSNNAGVSLNYSNGTSVGNIFSSDANIAFLEGGGMEYPFTAGTDAVFQPRVWNGNINYCLANVPSTSYLWNTGATTTSIQPSISSPSQFTIEVNTPGCPILYDTINVNISVPIVTGGLDIEVCMGENVLLHGEGAESYTWDNNVTDSIAFTASSPGTSSYLVTGTDSIGCINTDTVNVTTYNLPSVSAGADVNLCTGNLVTLSGQGAIYYTWSNGVNDGIAFDPISNGEYIVTGTDGNGCFNHDTVNITVYPLPVISGGNDQAVCYGSLTTLNGSGVGSGVIVYQWNNGISDNVAFIASAGVSTFIVTGTDEIGCVNYDTVLVTSTQVFAPIQWNGTTLSTATNPNGTLQWYNCDSQEIISNETNITFAPTTGGNYAVIVTDTINNCEQISDCQLVEFAGIETSLINTIDIYPNPTVDMITLTSSSRTIDKIQITDLVGKVIYQSFPETMNTIINLSSFEGKYFFVTIYSKDQFETIKVLKL
jgi:hypothetical protein